MSSEREKIAFLTELFATSAAHVICGVGDDAAVMASSNEPLVTSVDVAVEGTHFRRPWLNWEQLGYRASMAALSDLAAMGARPLGLLSSLILPPDVEDDAWADIARGQKRACTELSTFVVGGNLASGREVSITSTVLGVCATPLMRSGAKVGDGLWAAGPIGWAHLGLQLLLKNGAAAADVAPVEAMGALAAWRCPLAQIDIGQRACGLATAAIDLSDGLALDVARMAASSGVAVVLNAEALVSTELAAAAGAMGVDPKHAVLFGGEDYALVVAGPESLSGIEGLRRIGSCIEPAVAESRSRDHTDRPLGATQLYWNGNAGCEAVQVSGFDHFASATT